MESIRKLISETVMSLLNEAYTLEPNMVPAAIRAWVDSTIGIRVRKYDLEQRGEVEISMPFFEADREEWKMFKLVDGGAVPMEDVSFYRSGNEGDGVPVMGKKIQGNAVIPSGHVLVRTSRYLRSATLYTSSDAMKMLAPPPSEQDQLSDMELLALYQAKGLKSAYRHKFNPEVYQKLMSLGLMASNKSITSKGRNALESPELIDRLGGKYSSSKLDHLIRNNSWMSEAIDPDQRAEAVAFAKELKRNIAAKYGFKNLRVQLSKGVNEDPFIMVSTKGEVRELPEQLKRDCITMVYGPEEADRPSIGNISSYQIALKWSQWKDFLAS